MAPRVRSARGSKRASARVGRRREEILIQGLGARRRVRALCARNEFGRHAVRGSTARHDTHTFVRRGATRWIWERRGARGARDDGPFTAREMLAAGGALASPGVGRREGSRRTARDARGGCVARAARRGARRGARLPPAVRGTLWAVSMLAPPHACQVPVRRGGRKWV